MRLVHADMWAQGKVGKKWTAHDLHYFRVTDVLVDSPVDLVDSPVDLANSLSNPE